ncbi:hypothetical protein [Streptomyces purpureus]|uniref:Uncharacterized protein n=1 Tax=Streptomyces purpureus TaxID=1951 RepID=A0A918LSM8_9ACTN|nr:hypothetical protein [Streptomyces purpureus]GGT43643.1 hypothetical protein GCM10014713_41700 [Streptomyces purpureus]
MSAYMSRGAGVLVKLRVEHRLTLEELSLVLFATHWDVEDEEHFTVADVRQAVAARLVQEGSDAVLSASDRISEADEDEEREQVTARLAWARRLVAKAYRRDFAKFPAELAAFEAAGEPS